MARTFNRAPYSVLTPSNSDIKSYFFNQSNFKGLDTNKNFLMVDQETFSSCSNVYVDSTGLLRSRPSLKVKESTIITLKPNPPLEASTTLLYNVIDILQFGATLKVYVTRDNAYKYRYYIVSDLHEYADGIRMENEAKLVYSEGKLFIFANDSIKYYDESINAIFDATDYVYIPVTKTVTGNTVKENESPNVLTTSYITRYLFDNISNDYDLLIGKNVRITINDEVYEIHFQKNNEKVFVKDIRSFGDSYFSTKEANLGEPMVSVSDDGAVLISTYENNVYTTYYSVDRNLFEKIPDLPSGVLQFPVISADGHVAACFTKDKIYAYSLISVNEDGSKMFPEWTDLGEYLFDEDVTYNYLEYDEKSVLKLDTYDTFSILCYRTGAGTKELICYSVFGGIEYDTYIISSKLASIYRYNLNFIIYDSSMTIIVDVGKRYVFSVFDTYATEVFDGYYPYFNEQPWKSSYLFKSSDEYYAFSVDDTDTLFMVSSNNSYNYGIELTSDILKVGNSYLLTSNAFYILQLSNVKILQTIPLLFEATPVYVDSDLILLTANDKLYSTSEQLTWYADEITMGEILPIVPDFVSELSNYYFAKGNTLYISAYPSDGNFKWYLPKLNMEQMDYEITNLHPISSTEMAVFSENNVYYITATDNGYAYYKSKIPVGCKKGSDIITTFDGTHTIFSTDRGLAAMTYQDFVASTEQAISYLSDAIYDTYKEFNSSPIKLFKYDFWILCYKENCKDSLLFDIRTNSWWPMEYFTIVNKVKQMKDEVILISDKLYNYNNDVTDYYDYDGSKEYKIPWHLQSQKLHLNSPNYCKHISNITLTSVLETDSPISLNLTVANYRKYMNVSKTQNFNFAVDSIRTFVKKLNYSKVNEFQYLLTNEDYSIRNVPLSLSNITIKYKISKEVT